MLRFVHLALALALGVPAGPAAAAEPDEPSTTSKVGATALAVGLCEGLFLGYSALAAGHPREVGWTMVVLTPIAAGSGSAGNMSTHLTVVGAGAAIGLYNALELEADRYSRSQRFWRNMAAWHLMVVGAGVVDWATSDRGSGGGPGPGGAPAPGPEAPRVGLGVGLGAGGGLALLVAGRF